VTAAEREVIARIVRETCDEQNVPLIVPPEVCKAVATILSSKASRKVVADAAA